MSLNELLPTVHALSRDDRRRLLHYLVDNLAREQGVPPLEPDVEYPMWTPYNATEAAASLQRFLDEEGARS